MSILDGQHRLGMLKVLQDKNADLNYEQILVEVFPFCDLDGTIDEAKLAEEIFSEVNKAEPVKLVDHPGIAKSSHRNIINDSAEFFEQTYPEMFRTSQRCRVPHLNIDNLRDALFASNVIERHSIKSSKALQTWMIEQNDILAKKYQLEDAKHQLTDAALNKAKKFGFYLGLDSSWLYN